MASNSVFTIILLASLLAIFATCNGRSLQNDEGASKGDAGILRSYMDVRVRNPTSTDMCVWCWSGDHDRDRYGCSKNDQEARLTWDFQGLPWTSFKCRAEWGDASIAEFGVFGDGVPQKSSEWRVDALGKRREYVDSEWVNDHVGGWFGTTPTV